ncbi:MAG: GNAT family N-acetyltransferase [Candidatus Thermoplasmatota archaeon]|nr:GNAT family N-acetyltransferase [Candidatus Thermoplasmatota archaeon]
MKSNRILPGNVNIREAIEDDRQGVMRVAKSLSPRWFDNIAIGTSIPRDLSVHRTHVAREGGRIVGFIMHTTVDDKADIKWIGVEPGSQRKGIGSELYAVVEDELRRAGVREVRVETVAELTEYEPYERTRAFYEKMGFHVEKVKRTRSEETGEEFHMATYLKVLPRM